MSNVIIRIKESKPRCELVQYLSAFECLFLCGHFRIFLDLIYQSPLTLVLFCSDCGNSSSKILRSSLVGHLIPSIRLLVFIFCVFSQLLKINVDDSWPCCYWLPF